MDTQGNITVITATLDEITRMIDQKADERARVAARQNEFLKCTVDREFLERNYGVTRRKIEKYEKEKGLKRVDYLKNTKTILYRLEDFFKIRELAQTK